MNSKPITMPADPEESTGLYALLFFCGLAPMLVLSITALFGWGVHLAPGFDLGPTCIALSVMFCVLSVKTQNVNEYGVAFFYGKPLKVLGVGPHFVPLGLMQLLILPREIQEFQCPDEPDNVFKGHDDEKLPPNMVRPIRVTTGAPEPGKQTDGVLNVQSTFIASFVFRWRLEEKGLLRTIQALGPSFAKIKGQVEKQLRDIGEAVVAEDASKKTMEQFIAELPSINTALLDESEERFTDTGIDVVSALMISPDLGKDTSLSLSKVPQARAEAQSTIVKAEASRIELEKQGLGAAAAKLAMLKAEAEGQKKIMDDLDVSGESVLAAQAVKSISEKTDVLIAGAEGGMRDVLGLVKGAQSALTAKGGNKS